jgi:cytochrome c-type biogenesis protein CcmE
MSTQAAKVGLTATVVGIAFSALLYTSLSENLQYYKFVDEVMAAPHDWEGKPMRVHGYVKPGSIMRKPSSREYRFEVQHNGKVVTAFFTGSPPDAFKDDAEVILVGVLKGDRFHATEMSAKCPSKYEEGTAKRPKIAARQAENSEL